MTKKKKDEAKEEIIISEVKEKEIEKKPVEEEVKEKETPDTSKKVEKGTNPILVSLIIALVGVILLVVPGGINNIIGYVIGGAFLLAGLFMVIRFFKAANRPSSLSLVSGILYAIMGIIVLIKPDIIMTLAIIIFGIYFIVNGALKMYSGYMSRDVSTNGWKVSLITGVIIIIFGLILIIYSSQSLDFITKLAGAFLVIVAIYDIVNQIIDSRK